MPVTSTSSTPSSVPPTPPSTLSDSPAASNSRTTSSPGPSTSTKPPVSSAPPATSTAGEIPVGLNPKQITAAKASLATYRAYRKLIDQAYAEPGKDWSKQLAQVAAGPEANNLLQVFKETASRGQHGVGEVAVYPKVTKVTETGGDTTVTACVDTRGSDLLDKNGKSILVPDAKGAYRTHPETVVVHRFGADYLVLTQSQDWSTRCTPA